MQLFFLIENPVNVSSNIILYLQKIHLDTPQVKLHKLVHPFYLHFLLELNCFAPILEFYDPNCLSDDEELFDTKNCNLDEWDELLLIDDS